LYRSERLGERNPKAPEERGFRLHFDRDHRRCRSGPDSANLFERPTIAAARATRFDNQLEENAVAREQIALADFLLVNKTDLVDEAALTEVEKEIAGINPHARVFRTSHSKINLGEVLDVHTFDLDQKLSVKPEFLDELNGSNHSDIESFAFQFDQPFDLEKFDSELSTLCENSQVYRSKGILWVHGTPRRAVFHGVNNRFTVYWDRLWEKTDARFSQLVFIGKHLDEKKLRECLTRCLADAGMNSKL
jgi:G3E family GTPase